MNFPLVTNLQSLIRDPASFIIRLLVIFIALSVHEFAHAFAAHKMGDNTAMNQGRMRFNPLAHFDLFGFLSMMTVGLGWAKPVPVNPNNYRKRPLGDVVVGLAGVASNFVMAFLSILLYVVLASFVSSSSTLLGLALQFLLAMSVLNLSFCFFNLLPIPPLDGYGVLKETVLIGRVNVNRLWNFERYGWLVLIVLVVLPGWFGLPGLTSVVGWLVEHVWQGMVYLSLLICGQV